MNDIAVITTKKGAFAIVDKDDEHLASHCWHKTSTGYFARRDNTQGWSVYLHRCVNKTPTGFHTDHINGWKCDCRRANLRTATRAQNMGYNTKQRSDAVFSRFKGVSISKPRHIHPWRAMIRIHGKQKHLGLFSTENEAAFAYNAAAKLLFGYFARLNEV